MAQSQSISINKLLINQSNPRYEAKDSQIEALKTLVLDQEVKLLNLAEDIAENGTDPTQNLLITSDSDDLYVVLEGNRRVAAIKLMSAPSLVRTLNLSEGMTKKYTELHEKYKNELPTELPCAILTPEEADHWIYLRHTGENDGRGVVPWTGIQTERYRGSSPSVQLVDLVRAGNYIDSDTRSKLSDIAITNIGRVLGTPDARKLLGIDVREGKLVITEDPEHTIARLSMFVTDVAHKVITVSDIKSKEQRVEYAKNLAALPLPKAIHPEEQRKSGAKEDGSKKTTNGSKETTSASKEEEKTKKRKEQPAQRTRLIPPSLVLSISQPRINRIYLELKKINLARFINAASVTLRVFIELSLDEYANEMNINLRKPSKKGSLNLDKDMTLREKMLEVANYLENNKICRKGELQGIRTLAANKNHVLSVNSLHAYAHNKDYNPTPDDLKLTWDNIQPFIEAITIS